MDVVVYLVGFGCQVALAVEAVGIAVVGERHLIAESVLLEEESDQMKESAVGSTAGPVDPAGPAAVADIHSFPIACCSSVVGWLSVEN